MKRFTFLAALFTFLASSASANTTLNFTVQDSSGNALPSTVVYALHFSTTGGADGLSQIGVTNASGVVTFALTDSYDFEIYPSSQNYAPSLYARFNSPDPSLHLHQFGDGGVHSATMTLTYQTPSNTTGPGRAKIVIQNATPNILLFVSVQPNVPGYFNPVAQGVTVTDVSGASTVTVDNVPYATASSYNIGVYDPVKNKGLSRLATVALNAGHTQLSGSDVGGYFDFANSLPPVATNNAAAQNGTAGNLSVDGVVTDTNSVNTIPYVGMNFTFFSQETYCQGCQRQVWVPVDQNGRFQMFNLQQNTSYYAQINGTCSFSGQCYSGSQTNVTSTATPLGSNDFFYGSTPITENIKLNTITGGTGKMYIYVKDTSGNPVPQSSVGVWPDNQQHSVPGTNCTQQYNYAGLANANVQATTGYALVNNLFSGYYQINAWTPFSQNGGNPSFNNGPDGQACWQSNNCSCGQSDDYSILLDTNATPPIKVFNSSGTLLFQVSSITITIPVAQGLNGRVQGTLTFPSIVDLSNDPINITLWPQCKPNSPCSGGGFYSLLSPSTGPVVNYSIAVATGQAYWLDIKSKYWGIVRTGGGDQGQVNLTSTGTVTLNYTFARAGQIVGKAYKPDGTLFTSSFMNGGTSGSIDAEGDGGWGNGQIGQDGTFAIGGLQPGNYRLISQFWGGSGGATYTGPVPKPEAIVLAGKDTYKDYNLVNGVAVQVQLSTGSLPPMAIVNCGNNFSGECPPENYRILAVPQGFVFTQDNLAAMLAGDHRAAFEPVRFEFNTSSTSSRCEGDSQPIGWCTRRVPSPSVYDIFVTRKGEFDSGNLAGGVKPYFVLFASTKNVVANSSLANQTFFNPIQNSSTTVEVLNLNPLVSGIAGQGAATLSGTGTGVNVIRQVDFASLGGDFNKFIKYIPVISLFDSNQKFVAAGLIVPPPPCFSQNMTIGGVAKLVDDWFNQAVGNSDYNLFTTIMSNCGSFGYEIRGLKPNTTYTARVTSQNYPTYQTTVTVGADKSTTTLNLNFDQLVGPGAGLKVVVVSTQTSSNALSGALVTVESDGFKAKTLTTDATGTAQFDGLGPATYIVKVTLPGYVPGRASVDVSGTSTITSNVTLRLGGGTISGTVYAFPKGVTPPFGVSQYESGAKIYAYNDTLCTSGSNPDVPLYKTVTSSVGFYFIDGLDINNTVKLWVKQPGKFISFSTVSVTGAMTGVDVYMRTKSLDVDVFGHPAADGLNYEFLIKNPSSFKTGDAWINTSPFSFSGSTDVGQSGTLSFQQQPDGSLILEYPLSYLLANTDYVLHIEAYSYSNEKVVKELTFGKSRGATGTQDIDTALLGDDAPDANGHRPNEALSDALGGSGASLKFPVCSLIPQTSSDVPTATLTHLDSSSTSIQAAGLVRLMGVTGATASDLITVNLGKINYANSASGINLSVPIRPGACPNDCSDCVLASFNSVTGKTTPVPGLQTCANGMISVRGLKTLSSLNVNGQHPLQAQAVRGTFVPSRYSYLVAADSATFVIIRPSLIGVSYSGTTVRVFNFPNPFNLNSKNVPIVHGGSGNTSITTNGTVIKYEIPAAMSGQATIRIYTLDGQLVRELDQGNVTGGAFYYTQWDGLNKSGQTVANGVYYGILHMPGVKAKDATFKLAVVK